MKLKEKIEWARKQIGYALNRECSSDEMMYILIETYFHDYQTKVPWILGYDVSEFESQKIIEGKKEKGEE